jgi:predicted dehydrogenase
VSPPLRVGLVGGGVIGRQHLAAYRSLPGLFEVAGLCEVDEARAGGLDGLDVVDVCTPPYLHVPQVIEALEAGRHVICEKPLAGSLADLDRVAAAERRTGRRVMPIFQYRFGHGIQKLRHLVAQGVAGRAYLTTVETAWRRRPAYYAVPWRARWATELGGALVNLAIHAHDLACYVLGPPRSVYAHLATLVNPIEAEDCVTVSLEMADGSLGSFAVTTGSAHEISRHRFCFAHLTAESHTAPYRNTTDPWTFTPDSPEAGARIQEALAGFVPEKEGFAGQFERFHRALRSGGPLPVTLADARASLELITAIYHSARTRQPVQLPLAEGHPLYAGWQPAGPMRGGSPA